jgi:hypothetical protein
MSNCYPTSLLTEQLLQDLGYTDVSIRAGFDPYGGVHAITETANGVIGFPGEYIPTTRHWNFIMNLGATYGTYPRMTWPLPVRQ